MRFATLDTDRAELVDIEGKTLARLLDVNPLRDPDAVAAALPVEPGAVLIAWSGSMGQTLHERSPATWMPMGRESLDRFLDAAAPRLRDAGAALWLRPHARHVLSDAKACEDLLDRRREDPIGVFFDPASCFEPVLLPDAKVHLERMLAMMGRAASALLLASVESPPTDDRKPWEPDPADDPDTPPMPLRPLEPGGALPPDVLGDLVQRYASDDALVAFLPPDPLAQARLAGLA